MDNTHLVKFKIYIKELSTDELFAKFTNEEGKWSKECVKLCYEELLSRGEIDEINNFQQDEVSLTQDESVNETSKIIKNEPIIGRQQNDNIENTFAEIYGLYPVIKTKSAMYNTWETDISEMGTEQIVSLYDDLEYCDEYRYICYQELKKRYLDSNNFKKATIEEIDCDSLKDYDVVDDSEDEETFDDVVKIIGIPPETPKGGLNKEWVSVISELADQELLSRYDGYDYCDEYKYICYQELKKRILNGQYGKNEMPNLEENTIVKSIKNEDDEFEEEFKEIFGIMPQQYDEAYILSNWESQIREMSSDDIIRYYDSGEYSQEYMALCYKELYRRYRNGQIDITRYK